MICRIRLESIRHVPSKRFVLGVLCTVPRLFPNGVSSTVSSRKQIIRLPRIWRYTAQRPTQSKVRSLPMLAGVTSPGDQESTMAVASDSLPIETAAPSVLERAANLRGWLLGEATRIEAEKRIPDDVAQRLAAADLFRMTQPPRYGGLAALLVRRGRPCFRLLPAAGLVPGLSD